jgi:hypothetical protein
MHGSYAAVHAAVELDFGFDHGEAGSITEDTYFALLIAEHGRGVIGKAPTDVLLLILLRAYV